MIHLKKQDYFVISGLLAAIVLMLGIPFIHWGFLHDDFGVIWHSRISSWHQVLTLFTEPGMSSVVQPTNYQLPDQSFFAVLYRPFSYIFYAIQYQFFGFSAYGYFLVMIFLHALNTCLFFYLLRTFFPLFMALLTALFFGFHISYWDWMGWVAGQMHVLNATLILLIIYLIKYYADTGKKLSYFSALVLFLISLFTRETGLIMPLWIAWALYEYSQYTNATVISGLKNIAKIAFSFLCVDLIYLGTRFLFYPLKTSGAGLKIIINPLDFIINLQYRFFDMVTFAADVANLSWLAGGNRVLKGSLIASIFALLVLLFIFNRSKRIIILLLISGLLFMWPALLRYYASRYLYKALPFFITAGALLVTQFKPHKIKPKRWAQNLCAYIIILIIICNATLLFVHTRYRETVLHNTEQAFKMLAHDLQTRKEAPCFIGLPYDMFPTGNAQALWMYGYAHARPVFYDMATFVWRTNAHTKNHVSITIDKKNIHFATPDPEDTWWNPYDTFTKMGTIIINAKNNKKNVIDMLYVLEQRWHTQDLLFVTWDYTKQKFKILESKK